MDQRADKIHVTPLGDHWEIEAQSGKPLAHEEDKCEAIKTAETLAQEQGIETIILHEGDGTTAEMAAPQGQCLAMDMWFIEREKNLFAGHLRRDFLSSRA